MNPTPADSVNYARNPGGKPNTRLFWVVATLLLIVIAVVAVTYALDSAALSSLISQHGQTAR